MRISIPKKLAMVCVRVGCELVFMGPKIECPVCGNQGIPYADIEEMAICAPLPDTGLKMLTTMIQ